MLIIIIRYPFISDEESGSDLLEWSLVAGNTNADELATERAF